jgi:hypothetical protein
LQLVNPDYGRTRKQVFAATAVLALALWLFMAVAEVCTPLHAWLHGGAIPDDDHCAVALLAHGSVDVATVDLPPVVFVAGIEIVATVEISVFCPFIQNLPPGRAPPFLPSVS